MEIQFLGTSSGVPTKGRNVSGLAIRPDDSKAWCLVDCGEGTQHQIMKTELSLSRLTAVFITHVHGDHCYGLPGLLASAGMGGRKDALKLVAPAAVIQFLEQTIAITEMHLPYKLDFVEVSASGSVLELDHIAVDAVALSHRVPSFAYVFTERGMPCKLDVDKLKQEDVPQGPVWGRLHRGETVELDDGRRLDPSDFRMAPRPGRKIVVAGDNDSPELLADHAADAHLLVHETTYTEDVAERVGPGPQHSTAARVAVMAQKANLANLILTHFSPRYQDDRSQSPSIDDIEQEAGTLFSRNLWLARDLERYNIDTAGHVMIISKVKDSND